MKLIGINELSELTGKRRQSIRPLLDAAGIQPQPGPRRARLYPSDKALAILYTGAERLDAGQERAGLDRVRRQHAELELQRRRGELLERGAVCLEWQRLVGIARGHLIAIPGRVGAQLGHEAAQVAKALVWESMRVLSRATGEPQGDEAA